MPILLKANETPSDMPSVDFLGCFRGVTVEPDENPRMLVNFFIEAFSLLECTSWYEHTSDWDLRISIEFTDGRKIDYPAGATLEWEKTDLLAICVDDPRNVVIATSDDDLIIDPLTIRAITLSRV